MSADVEPPRSHCSKFGCLEKNSRRLAQNLWGRGGASFIYALSEFLYLPRKIWTKSAKYFFWALQCGWQRTNLCRMAQVTSLGNLSRHKQPSSVVHRSILLRRPLISNLSCRYNKTKRVSWGKRKRKEQQPWGFVIKDHHKQFLSLTGMTPFAPRRSLTNSRSTRTTSCQVMWVWNG